MFHRNESLLRDGTGLAVAGATLTVYVNGTDTNGDYTNATKATLYSANSAIPGNVIANPVTTDINGDYDYYIANGIYDEVAKYGSISEVRSYIQMVDLIDADAALWAAARSVSDRASLAALDPLILSAAYLKEGGRRGVFAWDSSNLKPQCDADTQQGLFVAPAGGDGSTGAWVRDFSGAADFRWFGAVADMTADGVGTNNTPMFDAARAALIAAKKSWLHLPQQAAAYRFSTAPAAIHDGLLLTGERHYSNPGQVGVVTYIGIQLYRGTVLGFAPDVPGFKLVAYTDNASNALAFEYQSSTGSAIRDMILYSEGGVGTTSHGIETFVKTDLDNLRVFGFAGDGVKLSGDDSGTANQYGNPINSHLRNVYCSGNKLHGFHVTGNNGNVIQFDNCVGQLNGGAAFLDQGPFGNHYSNCLAATNNASFGTPAGYSAAQRTKVVADYAGLATQINGSFVGYGGVGAHTYNGCYVEVGNGSYPDIGYQSVVNGGQLASYAWQFNVGTNFNPTINSGRGVDTPQLNFSTNQANSAVAFGNAKIYRHADRGLVLQGAPNAIGNYDVSIFNKNDAVVMSVNTGTTTARFLGTVQLDFSNILFNGASAFPGIGIATQAVAFSHATNGLNLAGWGGTYDVALGNKTNQLALAIPTATQNILLFGSLAAPGDITTSGGKVGYGTGAGGVVAQGTSRTTAVTLNKVSGKITLFSTTTTAGQTTTFTWNNSQLGAADGINWTQLSSAGVYFVSAKNNGDGTATVSIYTPAAVGVGEAPAFQFNIIKGVQS